MPKGSAPAARCVARPAARLGASPTIPSLASDPALLPPIVEASPEPVTAETPALVIEGRDEGIETIPPERQLPAHLGVRHDANLAADAAGPAAGMRPAARRKA